jgi:hypothetical protein
MADQATSYLLRVDGYELVVFPHRDGWLGVYRNKESGVPPSLAVGPRDDLESTKLDLCHFGYKQAGRAGPGVLDACREAPWEEIPLPDWIPSTT